MKVKDEETAPVPGDANAKLVSFLWSSQVDSELTSRAPAPPPCCPCAAGLPDDEGEGRHLAAAYVLPGCAATMHRSVNSSDL